MKTILITGDAGFVGSNLMNRLKNDYQIYGLTALGQDLLNLDPSKIPQFDVLIHLAGILKSDPSVWQVNVGGTVNILQLAKEKGCKAVIYISSYVYGLPKRLPINEQHSINPHNDYAKSKLAAEAICKNYNFRDLVILRPFNIYGPNQTNDLLIPKILRQIPNIKLFGSPDERRDFVYIDDFIKLISKIIKNTISGTYNVGSGRSNSVDEIIGILKEFTPLSVEYENKPSTIKDCYADITNIQRIFSWQPKTSLRDGLKAAFDSRNTRL